MRAILRAALAALLLPALFVRPAEAQLSGQMGPAPAPTPTPTPTPAYPVIDRVAQARFNLQALLDGRIAIAALDAQALQDVIDLDRALRGGMPDNRSVAERCVDDELRRAGGSPSRLARAVIDLKCREIGTSQLPRP